MTSLSDVPEDRADGLIWHGRYDEAEEIIKTLPDTSVRKRLSVVSLKWCYSIATGSVESLNEWQKSLDDALELCQGDSILGAVTGWVGGMFASSDETEEMKKLEKQAARVICNINYCIVSFLRDEKLNAGLYLKSAFTDVSTLPENLDGDGNRARFIRSVRKTWLGCFNLFLSYIPKDSWENFLVGTLGFETDREKGKQLLKAASKEKGQHSMPYAKMFLTLQGLIEASQDFRAGKDEALKSAFQRMEATCKQFGKAPMYHWMTSQLQRVAGNIDKALEEMQAVREGIQDIASKKPVYRIQKEIAWCYFVKGGEFDKVVELTKDHAFETNHVMRAWVTCLCACGYGMLNDEENYRKYFEVLKQDDSVVRTNLDRQLRAVAEMFLNMEDTKLAYLTLLFHFNQMNGQKPKHWFEQWLPHLTQSGDGSDSKEKANAVEDLDNFENALRVFLRSVVFSGSGREDEAEAGFQAIIDQYETSSSHGEYFFVPNAYYELAQYKCRRHIFANAKELCEKAKAFSGFHFYQNFSMRRKSLADYVEDMMKQVAEKGVQDSGGIDDY